MVNENLKTVNKRPGMARTSQTEKADRRQKKNNAGGFVFKVSKLDRAKRFLILGSDTSYYQSGARLSKENADNLIKVIKEGQSQELVDTIVSVSIEGRAAKQDAGLFALAVASSYGTTEERNYALSKLGYVARTGTSLFTFLTYLQQFRGWGRAVARAVANWYTEKDTDKLAFQAVKYRQRDGWTHRDVLRKAHANSEDEAFNVLARWIVRGELSDDLPEIVRGYELAKDAPLEEIPGLVRKYGLSWEMLPTSALGEADVWDALLDGNLPLGALIRQLPRLTRLGLIPPTGGRTQEICNRLKDPKELERARIHPISLLVALATYSSGRSDKGDSTWTPERRIEEALDKAFYASFKTAPSSGSRFMYALDLSASMTWHTLKGAGGMDSRTLGAALALVLANTEPETHLVGFSSGSDAWSNSNGRWSAGVAPLPVKTSDSLTQVVQTLSQLPAGGTDCALPMLYAMDKGIEVDCFVVCTDNETWAGSIHPYEALQQYRKKMGIDAKLIVLATEATRFSIADPSDPGMLDIAGFDSAVPKLITEFSKKD